MEGVLCEMLNEHTLVLIKPDAVRRGLVGEIIKRFERTGLKIVACKMISATREQLEGHFPKSEEWILGMGEKTLESCRENGIDPRKILGTADSYTIGQKIKKWNYYYLMDGPIVAMVLEGVHAINTVRKLVGNTAPCNATPGTIRGDFSIDSPILANILKRASENIIHASGTPEEAKQEIACWFTPNEIQSYEKKSEKKGGST